MTLTGLLALRLAVAAPDAGPVAGAPPAPGEAARPAVAHRPGRSNAEARLQAWARELKLDAAQRAKVVLVLEEQQEALRRLARAPADPDVPRVVAIRAITSRTAERIRAVLNDEQRKQFGQPLPPDYAPGKGQPGVEDWLRNLRKNGI